MREWKGVNEQMKFYCEEKDAVLQQLNASPEGLSAEEAARRLEENGRNRLADARENPCCAASLSSLPTP